MMRYVCVVGLAAVIAGGCSPSVNLELERNALLQRDRDWAQTAKDVDRFVSFLATDASVYAPGAPVAVGADAVRAMFAQMSAAPGFSLTWAPLKAEVAASGDVGYTAGTYTASAGGAPEKGKYVTVWKKQGDVWMVSEDIFNADSAGPPAQHAMVAPAAMVWTDPPPGLPVGARVAVISGDPSQPVPFVLRAMMPAGYTVPLHWHPTTENLTVLSGTAAIGMDDKTDTAAMATLPAGGFVVLPAEMRHVFVAKTAATIQVHGIGPFAITYVNAADDPRQKK
jgi:ketosteroid isomerase-like protein